MIKRRGSPERCKSGIEGLDDISGGGFPKNRLHLVHGDPGVGKTTLAMQFLLAGKAEKQKCLYITLSETAEELQGVAESHGWGMAGIELFDLSAVEQRLKAESRNTLFHPAEVELNQTTDLSLREIARIQPQRVVFDSLSELRLLAQSPFAVSAANSFPFPRLIASEHSAGFSPETINTGIGNLDTLLGGGFDCGTSNLILGPSGCGKSAVVLNQAVTMAKRGERTVFFAFDENLSTLVARAELLNLSMKPRLESGVNCLQQVDPAELSPGELTLKIRRQVEENNVRMVVIDSLNGYTDARPEEKFLALQLHELLAYLGHKGVLTFLVVAQRGMLVPMTSAVDLTYLSDTVILMRFEVAGNVKQAISVFKKRSGAHERSLREFQIGPEGIRVSEPLNAFHGVLTGVPQFAGDLSAMLGKQHDSNN